MESMLESNALCVRKSRMDFVGGDPIVEEGSQPRPPSKPWVAEVNRKNRRMKEHIDRSPLPVQA